MRTKLFVVLFCFCTTAALGAGSAVAAAETSSLWREGKRIEGTGETVEGASTDLVFYLGGGSQMNCQEVRFSGELVENGPVARVAPTSTSFTGCLIPVGGVGSFAVKISNAEIPDDIEFTPSGETPSFTVSFILNSSLGLKDCPYTGGVAFSWVPLEWTPEPTSFEIPEHHALTTNKEGCYPELEPHGHFALKSPDGTPISVVNQP